MSVTPPLEDEAILQEIDNEKIEASAEDRAAMEADLVAKKVLDQATAQTPAQEAPAQVASTVPAITAEERKLLDACASSGISLETIASFDAYKASVVADVTRKATILGDDAPAANAQLTELIALNARYDKMMQKQNISGHTKRTTVESSDGDIARPITQIAKEKV